MANFLLLSARVFPNVSPGYMCSLVPETTPQDGESWEDIERVIMPGVSILFIILPHNKNLIVNIG
jgi:hypothetical protein